MSLSSLLLGSKVDAELDNLFKTSLPTAPDAPPIPGPSKDSSKQKRKLETEKRDPTEKPHKRSKGSPGKQPHKPVLKSLKDTSILPKSKTPVTEKSTQKKSSKKGKEKEIKPRSDDEDSDDNSDLENAYLNKEKAKPTKEPKEDDSGSSSNENHGEEGDGSFPVHESLKKEGKRRVKQPKKKTAPEDETPERRDQRTIFVGNLPIEVASRKPLKKQLQHHILSFVPTAKIESVRFRSIPFQAPATTLPASDDEGSGSKAKSKAQPAQKELRPHEKERATNWRTKRDEKDEENVKADEKKFLNPAQKKKIAFINQEFHATADTVNGYIVFAPPPSTEGRPANLPPLPPTMDPYDAAVLAAGKCDGSLFMERVLRADLVGKNRNVVAPRLGNDDGEGYAGILEADPRLSVFVGNLDFASKEEDLRAFFEDVVTVERGAPPVLEKEDVATSETKKPSWVTRVRIVRDKETLLGKGFAYVQFVDRECVDELLALEESKLKFAKRKLRVQRCKTLPGSKEPVASGPTTTAKGAKWTGTPTPIVIPQGNPALGEKLVGLPKEERKKLKSTDADRVARRLAKKKARMAMEKSMKGKVPGGKPRKRVRS